MAVRIITSIYVLPAILKDRPNMTNDNEKYSFQTDKGILELNLIDVVEPNNGRMLYKVLLHLDNEDITKKYFDNWNFINFYLDKYAPLSVDKKWIYIPKEGDHFLIDTQNLEKKILPNLTLSAATFIGNYFLDNYLIILGSEEIVQKNLLTKTTKLLKQVDKQIYFRELKIFSEQKLLLTLSNGQTKKIDIETLELFDE